MLHIDSFKRFLKTRSFQKREQPETEKIQYLTKNELYSLLKIHLSAFKINITANKKNIYAF